MRELKFRFWSNHLNKFVTPDDSIFVGALKDPDMNPMQFTGINDKHGKGIYEGDVLSAIYLEDGEYTTIHAVVIWQDQEKDEYTANGWGAVAFYEDEGVLVQDDIGSFSDDVDPGFWHNFEVVGNIFENPEFYEAKNA